jgi:hypothetical protein
MENEQRAAAGKQQPGKALSGPGGFDFRDHVAVPGTSCGGPEECGRLQTRPVGDIVQRRNPEKSTKPVPVRGGSARLKKSVCADTVPVGIAPGDQAGMERIGLGRIDAPHLPANRAAFHQFPEIGKHLETRQVYRGQSIYRYDNHAPVHG